MQPVRVKAQVLITLDQNNQVHIEAPRDKILTLGLIELAKDAVLEADAKPPEAIQAVPAAVLERLNGAGPRPG